MEIFGIRFANQTDAAAYLKAKQTLDAAEKACDEQLAAWQKLDANKDKTREEFAKDENKQKGTNVSGKTLCESVDSARKTLDEAEQKAGMSIGMASLLVGILATGLGVISTFFMPILFPFSQCVIPAVAAIIGLLAGGSIQKFRMPCEAEQPQIKEDQQKTNEPTKQGDQTTVNDINHRCFLAYV
ncbi:MAG: hypothetical protein LBF26_02710 [Puniceicoccales bacterium]|jgi:hypothetical protein|nr:hypothetical protein [Puniceicoccales bacterium]